MKHTPTPWGFGDIENNAICAKGGEGFIIHRSHSTEETPDQFDHSDLEYIVHCVNNHAEMLETLERIRALLKDNPHVRVQSNEIGNDLAVALLFERIDEAITKAKGE